MSVAHADGSFQRCGERMASSALIGRPCMPGGGRGVAWLGESTNVATDALRWRASDGCLFDRAEAGGSFLAVAGAK